MFKTQKPTSTSFKSLYLNSVADFADVLEEKNDEIKFLRSEIEELRDCMIIHTCVVTIVDTTESVFTSKYKEFFTQKEGLAYIFRKIELPTKSKSKKKTGKINEILTCLRDKNCWGDPKGQIYSIHVVCRLNPEYEASKKDEFYDPKLAKSSEEDEE